MTSVIVGVILIPTFLSTYVHGYIHSTLYCLKFAYGLYHKKIIIENCTEHGIVMCETKI